MLPGTFATESIHFINLLYLLYHKTDNVSRIGPLIHNYSFQYHSCVDETHIYRGKCMVNNDRNVSLAFHFGSCLTALLNMDKMEIVMFQPIAFLFSFVFLHFSQGFQFLLLLVSKFWSCSFIDLEMRFPVFSC